MFFKKKKSVFKGTRLVVRGPLRQTKADLSRAKDTFARIYAIVVLYFSPFLIEMRSANLLWKRFHSSAIPPVEVKTKSVKVPCPTSNTLFNNNGRSLLLF